MFKQLRSMSSAAQIEFEQKFITIYPLFNNRLIVKHPTLTPVELKICACLKMNLDSKSIGELYQRNYRTIENCRHKIRTKMALKKNQNLVTYIMSIN